MTLVGGRHHLHYGNCNAANAVITVENCVFSISSSTSIKVLNQTDDPPPFLPHFAGWDRKNSGNNVTNLQQYGPYRGSSSTQMIVRDCGFFNNEQIIQWNGGESERSQTACTFVFVATRSMCSQTP